MSEKKHLVAVDVGAGSVREGIFTGVNQDCW